MKVGVIGVGHVGLVTAGTMAELGHQIVGMDDDAAKISALQDGRVPFYEPGLDELIETATASGRLTFTTDPAEVVAGTDVVFICVGTPRRDDGAPNLEYVQAAAASVSQHATDRLVVAEKSTVPVRTGERIAQSLRLEAQASGRDLGHEVVSNPEFLREGTAVEDTLRPDRIVVGADSEHAHAVMRELYEPLLARHDCPYVATDVRTAELIKHASNAFLATKISFINAVARICELAGADVHTVAEAMGHDARIGRAFLNAGLGYGGSCLLPDETVLAAYDDVVELLPMEELWARVAATGVDGWSVLAWRPETQEPEYLPLSAATVRPYSGPVVEVRTKMGRRLRTTADHPFVVGDGHMAQTRVVQAGDLTTADWLPMTAGARFETGLVDGPADLLAAVTAGAIDAGEVVHRLDGPQRVAVAERPAMLPAPRRYDVARTGALRLAEYEALGIELRGGMFGTARNGTHVPGELPIDEDLCRMLGLYVAEGYVTADGRRRRICWTFHPTDESHLVEFVAGFWERHGVKVTRSRRATAMAVSLSSRLLAYWFTDALQLGADCYRKAVPPFLWSASPSLKRAFLRGLWDGDGSWSRVAGGPSVVLEYGTVSRRLADGILRLLGDLGIVAGMRTGRTAKSTVDTYWIRISGADQIEQALWLFDDDEAAQIRASMAQQSKRIAPTGYRRANARTSWLRISDLRTHDYDGPVYSLEVPGAHTIVSTGGLVTHNCFPKDVEAFIHIASSLGYEFGMLRETERINREAKQWPLQQLRRLLWNVSGKEIAVLGVAFKPGTDDVRDAPALDVIDALRAEGAVVRLHDPVALPAIRDRYPDAVFCDKAEEALRGAHAVVLCTEWDEYRALTPERLLELLQYPVVVDARAAWDAAALADAGLTVASVGRALPLAG